jgi:hypothetical protein
MDLAPRLTRRITPDGAASRWVTVGWLSKEQCKKGSAFALPSAYSEWGRRYFRLGETTFTYAHNEGGEGKSIPISSIKAVNELSEASRLGAPTIHCFQVTLHGGKKLTLCAGTQDDMRMWVQRLSEAQCRHNGSATASVICSEPLTPAKAEPLEMHKSSIEQCNSVLGGGNFFMQVLPTPAGYHPEGCSPGGVLVYLMPVSQPAASANAADERQTSPMFPRHRAAPPERAASFSHGRMHARSPSPPQKIAQRPPAANVTTDADGRARLTAPQLRSSPLKSRTFKLPDDPAALMPNRTIVDDDILDESLDGADLLKLEEATRTSLDTR